MSFLTDHRGDVPLLDPPKRAYARLDRLEPPDDETSGPRLVLFDCVDADWFDEQRDSVAWLGDEAVVDEADENISVVEAPFGPEEVGAFQERFVEGNWFHLRFDQGVIEVEHYLNLFAPPLTRTIEGWRPVEDQGTREALESATGFGDLPDASEAELRSLLSRLPKPSAAAVYDVGHGNCTALLDSSWPVLYFDFGGGVIGNRDTFPQALERFCVTEKPLIVLSHWDYDHWSSAMRDTRALERCWIVPRQDDVLGPTHAAFLGKLQSRGQVLIWPAQTADIQEGGIRIERCTGPLRSRNDSGLALIAEGPSGRMLFPGDCSYRHVPGRIRTSRRSSCLITGVVLRRISSPLTTGNRQDASSIHADAAIDTATLSQMLKRATQPPGQ